jgi:lipoprotein-anchoring transpeptidase ErfK/SrfK
MTLSLTSVLLSTLAPALLATSDSTNARPNPGSGAPIVASAPVVVATAGPTPAPIAPAPATRVVAPAPLTVAPAPLSVAANGRRYFGTADSIVVEKASHRLTLFRDGVPVVSYSVALGQNPVGHKERAGDKRTPEGLYHIDARNPNSRFHLGLHVSYPNAADRARAARLGIPTGGDIMIHGLPNGQGTVGAAHRQYDWTNGCVAVTDEEIEELWQSVPVGTPIRILP